MSFRERLEAEQTVSRIWRRETAVFAAAPAPAAVHEAIGHRLGWLDAPHAMAAQIGAVRSFADQARRDGLIDVHLLGMGGSSLCAEVLRETAPTGLRGASVTVLDTTDEQAVDDTAAALSPGRTLFLVASKSGTTIEVSSLERYFGSLISRSVGQAAGGHFAAITDPGTPLVAHAREQGYRETFLNPPDIGGRYSALSLFGLVPAALLGLDLEAILGAGQRMADRCRADGEANPGLALGAFMAEQAASGRDKLTVLLPPALEPLGAWIEQLVAESTGKEGRGVLPVVDEPPGSVEEYAGDRAFVVVEDAESDHLEQTARALEQAGHPVFRVEAADGLGGEFFRWEFATAVAGAGLGINPFDEPNVRDAKARTQTLLDGFWSTGALRVDPSLKPMDGLADCLIRGHRASAAARGDLAGRYVAFLDYLPANPARVAAISRLRQHVRRTTRMATTYGVGPRYLHSTGQYHKGGPNTGVFVLLTAPDATTTSVPGTEYSFSTLKQAQALGDFDALAAAGRDVLHFHFDRAGADVAGAVERVLTQHGYAR
jgi:glucose-6-phosphate isomerase